MNNQQRKDLATRSLIGDSMINLLRRAPGLHLLTFKQGLNEHEVRVPATDTGDAVQSAVEQGFEFSGISPVDQSLVFRKLEGLFYPLAAGAHAKVRRMVEAYGHGRPGRYASQNI